jgi:hypothetical protein
MGICPFFANVSGDDQAISTETVECRGAACQIWDVESNNCSIATTGRIIHHYHEGHLHNVPHIVEDISNVVGGASVATTLPYAATLTQEYACFQDADGNGKIFGLDFKFIVDEFLPPALSGIQRNPELANKDIPEISWRDLYNWKMSGGDDPLANVPSRL